MKVYPIGYSNKGPLVDKLMSSDPNMLLIDTRHKPTSWRPQWKKHALKALYGDRYRWAGAYLGNLGFQDGYIKIVDPATGIRGLVQYLSEGYDLILLCQCPNYDACHVSCIVDLLLREFAVEVIHLDVPDTSSDIAIAISVTQPYASWLANPEAFIKAGIPVKYIENRNWTTKECGRIFFQAPQSFDETAIPFWESRFPNLGEAVSLNKDDYPRGYIVGEANLARVITVADKEARNPWFRGRYGFVFEDAKPIVPPIAYPGNLGIFQVLPSVLERHGVLLD